MAWIRPDMTRKFINISIENLKVVDKMLDRHLHIQNPDLNLNLKFDDVYSNSVYSSYNELLGLCKYIDYYNLKIDTILFTGHAGNGHRAPTRAIAKKLISKTNKHVIVIDILAIYSELIAKINDNAWVSLSRSSVGQWIWKNVIRGEINPEKSGLDISPIFKILYPDILKKFIKKISPKVVLSTFPYSNAILSKIASDIPSIQFAGVVVTDIEMLGFAMSSYGDVSNLHYFVASKLSWENGLKVYPYLSTSKGPIYIGTNPCFFDKEVDSLEVIKDTVLFIPGSAEGLGRGIKALPKLAKYCEDNGKKLITIAGRGRSYEFAKKVNRKYPSMACFSYVASNDMKQLISKSEVIIAKAGGNQSSEFVSKSGCKIFFASIDGQETDNAKYYANLGVATNVANDVKKLLEAVEKKPYTPSVYKKGVIQKSAVDTVIDTILPYLDE